MKHVVIQDKNGIFSIDINRITSSYYGNNGFSFKLTVMSADNSYSDKLIFDYETAEEALEAYEEFLGIISRE